DLIRVAKQTLANGTAECACYGDERHSGVCLLPWRTAQQGSPATVAAAQGGRHIPCAVPKIQSVAKRTLANGTAECACYGGERHSVVCLLPLRTAQQGSPAAVADGTA
ncbi:MAG: hypothetical protein ACKN85_07335, partial [Pirellula sp.]